MCERNTVFATLAELRPELHDASIEFNLVLLQQMQQTSATDCLGGRPNQHKSIGRPRFLAAGIPKTPPQIKNRPSIFSNPNRPPPVPQPFQNPLQKRLYSV